MKKYSFEWDESKNQANIRKHGISFEEAELAFYDENRVIADDLAHTTKKERRFYCIGFTEKGIVTVRFTIRGHNIRIYGAGYWRGGKRTYEKENKVH